MTGTETIPAAGDLKQEEKIMKKICKSKDQKLICGVCGGIAEYLDVDPTIVRLLWVAFSLAGGSGLLAYFLAAVIMPEAKETA